jgi:hypothetical protein
VNPTEALRIIQKQAALHLNPSQAEKDYPGVSTKPNRVKKAYRILKEAKGL